MGSLTNIRKAALIALTLVFLGGSALMGCSSSDESSSSDTGSSGGSGGGSGGGDSDMTCDEGDSREECMDDIL